MTDDGAPATFLRFDEIAWSDPGDGSVPSGLVQAAQRLGARRKRMATGQAGFYMNHSVMPPDFTVPPHSHDHDELIVIVAGGCTMLDGGPALQANDAMVLRAGHRYGFRCGPDGMIFLTIRTAEASTDLA